MKQTNKQKLDLLSAVFIAQTLVAPSKPLEQMIQIERNILHR